MLLIFLQDIELRMLRMSRDIGGGFAVGHAYFSLIAQSYPCVVNQPCCLWPVRRVEVADYVGSRQLVGWCSIAGPLPAVQVSQNDCAMTR